MRPETQQQFLQVVDRDEALRRFRAVLSVEPQRTEVVPLRQALGRVLAEDIVATVDVPSFDRSNLDGFAVAAADTYGASEEAPRELTLLAEVIATAVVPQTTLQSGQAMVIATGGMIPRGADAILMVEHADCERDTVFARHSVVPGQGITFAGTDMTRGETVLRRGQRLTSRETGVLAAIGAAEVTVISPPQVAILSTGDEIIEPGQPMRPGLVYDSNAQILSDSVRELGAVPVNMGIVRDDYDALKAKLLDALRQCDVVVLSGGTSKGAGDICYRVVAECTQPGIAVHGVALKPGKPICLASHLKKPVVILPGFPTSAIFTFHEFLAPVIRELAGLPSEESALLPARIATKVNSEIGRQEYVLVGLVSQVATSDGTGLTAYPMGKGSGSVTSFSRADGFVIIDRHQELLEAGSEVTVHLLGRGVRPADLVVIGSHCIRLDRILSRLHARGVTTKFLAVGSQGGLAAARRGECDIAGIHLLDPQTDTYNLPFLTPDLELIPGYRRKQGLVYRRDDPRFDFADAEQAFAAIRVCPDLRMINRNAGSGTRVLIDQVLGGLEPSGYAVQARSHQAVAVAVLQKRADWGIAIDWVVDGDHLGFLPLRDEQFDFVTPRDRAGRPAMEQFREVLAQFQEEQD